MCEMVCVYDGVCVCYDVYVRWCMCMYGYLCVCEIVCVCVSMCVRWCVCV